MDIKVASIARAVVNNAAMNTGVYASFWIMGFLRVYAQ